MRYGLIKADGTRSEIEVDKPLELEELQEKVGGYIEFVRYGDSPLTLCVDEDGLLKEKPINKGLFDMHIVGDALLGKINKAGEFVGYDVNT